MLDVKFTNLAETVQLLQPCTKQKYYVAYYPYFYSNKQCTLLNTVGVDSNSEAKTHLEQVDVLPSKNQALCCKLNLLIYCPLIVL